MHEQMTIPPQEVEVIRPDPRIYDILEQMLDLQSQMLATFGPAMIYTTGKPKTEESPPCPS